VYVLTLQITKPLHSFRDGIVNFLNYAFAEDEFSKRFLLTADNPIIPKNSTSERTVVDIPEALETLVSAIDDKV
jgi:hypothetical protein